MANEKGNQLTETEAVEKLARVVRQLDEDFAKRRTWWWSFSHGLLYGVGTALGATVLFVLIFYIFMKLEGSPVFGGTVSSIIDQFFVGQEIGR